MKKAKTEGGIAGKTADIMSMIRNFVSKPQDERENGEAGKAKPNLDLSNAAAPPVYQCNAYANLIERHDKKVKNILKNLEKEKENPSRTSKKTGARKKVKKENSTVAECADSKCENIECANSECENTECANSECADNAKEKENCQCAEKSNNNIIL